MGNDLAAVNPMQQKAQEAAALQAELFHYRNASVTRAIHDDDTSSSSRFGLAVPHVDMQLASLLGDVDGPHSNMQASPEGDLDGPLDELDDAASPAHNAPGIIFPTSEELQDFEPQQPLP